MSELGRVLNTSYKNVNFNLALDEAILRLHNRNDFILTFRLWTNPRSVILGRSQNINTEVNLDYCYKHNIEVARRFTGGGTVYHDLGNFNTSLFIPKEKISNPIDVVKTSNQFCQLIRDCLQELGLHVYISGSSNLFHNNKKVSGAASYFTKDYVLYHSTLLISANLKNLENSLIHNDGTLRGSSKYYPTANVELNIDDYQKELISHLEDEFQIRLKSGSLTNQEINLAEKLKSEIYAKREWLMEGNRVFKIE